MSRTGARVESWWLLLTTQYQIAFNLFRNCRLWVSLCGGHWRRSGNNKMYSSLECLIWGKFNNAAELPRPAWPAARRPRDKSNLLPLRKALYLPTYNIRKHFRRLKKGHRVFWQTYDLTALHGGDFTSFKEIMTSRFMHDLHPIDSR